MANRYQSFSENDFVCSFLAGLLQASPRCDYQIHVAGNVLSYQTGRLTGGQEYMIKVRKKRM